MPCKLERCHPVVWLRIWGTNGQPMSSCLARHTKCATNRFNRSAWDQNIKPCKAEKKPRIYASKPHAAPVLSLCRPGVWRSLRGSSTKWGKNKRWDLHFKTISEEVYNICNLYSQFFTYMTYIEYNHRIMCIYIYIHSIYTMLLALQLWRQSENLNMTEMSCSISAVVEIAANVVHCTWAKPRKDAAA